MAPSKEKVKMSVVGDLQKQIKGILNEFAQTPIGSDRVVVEITNDAAFGEITTNAAMVLAKDFRMPPLALAKKLLDAIGQIDFVKNVEIAGPGFINVTLHEWRWLEELKKIVTLGSLYTTPKLATGEAVHIEFVSANPTGPMHAGHVRNAILGDTIATLLKKVGYSVYKEYYINNAGKQVEFLGRSVYLRYKEALGQELPTNAFDGDLYPGEYLVPIGQDIARQYEGKWLDCPEHEWGPFFQDFTVNAMMDIIRQDLKDLGVVMDFYASEKQLITDGKVEKVVQQLTAQNDVYEGVLTPPKGVIVDDWEERPQLLFRATKYGDDVDRPLRKSDGLWTYFASDIAYHFDKIQRGFSNMINVLGADHCGYVKRITAATEAISQKTAKLTVKLFQIVNFFENGQPIKMSKRAGVFVSSRDIVQKVGKDVARFMMVSRSNGSVIDFDFQKAIEQSQDNPIFYIQYAHSRICSVLNYAKEIFPGLGEEEARQCDDLSFLGNAEEMALIRTIAHWPEIIEQAAKALEPHRIANYLYTVANDFHRLWNFGKTSLHLRFVNRDSEAFTRAKLFLLSGVATVLRDGLELLGVVPLRRM
ncbi:MAG: arginine--tRNA ligase [Holosporales bacterium]|nr:arginine--tRNA ligase [Holosporales bacterium]